MGALTNSLPEVSSGREEPVSVTLDTDFSVGSSLSEEFTEEDTSFNDCLVSFANSDVLFVNNGVSSSVFAGDEGTATISVDVGCSIGEFSKLATTACKKCAR